MVSYYSPTDVANKLGLKPTTIRKYIKEKKIVAIRFGGVLRITDEEFSRFVSQCRTTC